MLDRAQIIYVHWQMAGRAADGALTYGEIAAELDDLDLEIRNLIMTQPGSVVGNPEKGVDLDKYRDRPQGELALFVVAELRAALERWIPRIELGEIRVRREFTRLTVEIDWRPREAVQAEFQTTVVRA